MGIRLSPTSRPVSQKSVAQIRSSSGNVVCPLSVKENVLLGFGRYTQTRQSAIRPNETIWLRGVEVDPNMWTTILLTYHQSMDDLRLLV
jgi:hypothetical protein